MVSNTAYYSPRRRRAILPAKIRENLSLKPHSKSKPITRRACLLLRLSATKPLALSVRQWNDILNFQPQIVPTAMKQLGWIVRNLLTHPKSDEYNSSEGVRIGQLESRRLVSDVHCSILCGRTAGVVCRPVACCCRVRRCVTKHPTRPRFEPWRAKFGTVQRAPRVRIAARGKAD